MKPKRGVKLLLDEQISGKVADRLRDRGRDVTAATDDPTLPGLSDPDLFEVAQEQGRALVMDREHHGLVIAHPTRFLSWEFARLVTAIDSLLEEPGLVMSFLIWLRAPSG